MRMTAAGCTLFALSIVGASALAQTERTGNADARMQQQLQQLTSERIALQSENTRLKQELEAAKKDLASATAGRAALESRARTLAATASRGEAESREAEEQLTRTRERLQELVEKFRETAQTLREVETDRASARTELAARQRELDVCVDRNAELYHLNVEVLDRMEDRGVWSALTEREPFTQIKRARLENLIDDYRYRADELRLEREQREEQQAKVDRER